ncbi:MAG: hypothetical protein J7J15_00360 [Candidatus Aenigmarchaeota archaeon]|nr:hypothetical protein [Candidatus Aenigmarchaeota archaeon]
MISAREGNIVFLKLSKNENLNDLQNLIETYEIKSGFLEGFGEFKIVETESGIIEVKKAIIFGIISELRKKPYIELYCYSNEVSKINNFVAEEFIIIIRKFDDIELKSRLNEKGNLELSIGEETTDK